MRIVAITACPTGIAHTYMAAEALERAGTKLGHQVKVETQGAMGIENALTAADIAAADAVIFAVDLPVQRRERFAGKTRLLEVPVQAAIKNPASLFAQLG